MNLTNIFIIMFAIIGTITIIFFSLFFIFKKIKEKFSSFYTKLNEFLLTEPYNEAKTALKTVDFALTQTKQNHIQDLKDLNDLEESKEIKKINEEQEKFATSFNTIEENILSLKKLKFEGQELLKKNKLKQVYNNIKKIKEILASTDKLSNNVEKKSKEYFDEFQKINSVIWQYRNEAKIICQLLNNWKNEIGNEKFKKNVSKKVKIIEDLNISLENYLNKRKIKESKKKFQQYKQELFLIYEFANYFDSFQLLIFKQIPNKIKYINDVFLKLKKIINSELEYLNFSGYFQKINEINDELINYFIEFNIEKTILKIDEIVNLLEDIYNLISKEWLAFQFISSDNVNNFIEHSFQNINRNFINIKNEISNALLIDDNYFNELKSENDYLEQQLNEITKTKHKIQSELFDKNISSTSKQYKYKNYIYSIKNFNDRINVINKNIKTFYAEGINSKLKYSRLKQLFLYLRKLIIEKEIYISKENKLQIQEIENKKNEIDLLLISKNQINEEELNQSVNDIQTNIANFLNKLGKNILIIKIYWHLIEKFSFLRIQNLSFNQVVVNSQIEMKKNNYYKSLEILINGLESEIN